MTVVIVGAGQAGATAAAELRAVGYTEPVILLGAEDEPPYERPPLSKGYLQGNDEDFVRIDVPASVDVRTGVSVDAVDLAARTVTAGGETIGYDALLLATGVEPRVPDLVGAAQGFYLREHADADALRAQFTAGRSVVIVGAGWIGCETAAAARQAGCDVVMLTDLEQPVDLLGPEVGAVFAAVHREHGVDLRTRTPAGAVVVRDGRAVGVELADGSVVDADVVIVATGSVPRTGLAEAAGLTLDEATRGIAVDGGLRTSDPAVWAAGDVAAVDHPLLGRRVRVEHWAVALDSGKVAARAIAGQDATVDFLPFFFSDQYDFSMEYCGYAPPGSYERVVFRGDTTGSREFVAFWQDADDRVVAAMNANVWDVNETLQALIASRRPVSAERLADPGVAFADL